MIKSFPRGLFYICYSTLAVGFGLFIVGCGDVMMNSLTTRNEGIKQYNEGQYAEASSTFRTLVRYNPADYGSVYFLGACMAKMGSYEQAIEKYRTTLVLMDHDIKGQDDRPFRRQCINSLADAIVKSKDRDIQSAVEPNMTPAEKQFLMAKINRGLGDADAALESYAQASLLAPKDFDISKEYGLYLLQLSQNDKARNELRRAYAMNDKDAQVASSLRRLGVVPGPGLKREEDLQRPVIPVGPIPEVQVQVVIPASDRTRPDSE